jgi:hypothetical protein
MSILTKIQRLFQRITKDSVSCGALAIFAIAIGLFIIMIQTLTIS